MERKKGKARWVALGLLILLTVSIGVIVLNPPKKYSIRGTDLIAPCGLLHASDGTFYVADGGLNAVLRYEGERTENVAGYTMPYENGEPAGGCLNAQAGLALFDTPFDMEEWGGGIVVSDRENNMLRIIKEGMVTTLAGQLQEGSLNGQCKNATFHHPCGLAVDDKGNLLIADSGNGKVRLLSEDMCVHPLISGLEEPTGLCWANGALYIADRGTGLIWRWKDKKLEAIAGNSTSGYVEGPAREVAFNEPTAVLVQGDCIYIADTGNRAIRKLKDGKVSTHMVWEHDPQKPWPGRPTALEEYNGKIYAADGFAGIVFEVEK